ncbi:hypothetical protein A0H81_00453 [Grifola frondosa]|uniref:Carbonic anhydrase n=1 Tax=Grifola frondosa TaxID=5627 RepID=A0A1C7MQJ4_GRIFR|nr:hypothetical protein A0H81_00453 [Grifola frondosa]
MPSSRAGCSMADSITSRAPVPCFTEPASRRRTSVHAQAPLRPRRGIWRGVFRFQQRLRARGSKGDLRVNPTKKLIVVTCMDARLNNPFSQLGITEGQAHIIRNAGGLAKDSLRSIIISQRLLGTRKIAVFRHTDCGMTTFTTPELRQRIRDSDPGNDLLNEVDKIDFLEFKNLEKSLRDDVRFLRRTRSCSRRPPSRGGYIMSRRAR